MGVGWAAPGGTGRAWRLGTALPLTRRVSSGKARASRTTVPACKPLQCDPRGLSAPDMLRIKPRLWAGLALGTTVSTLASLANVNYSVNGRGWPYLSHKELICHL